VGSGNALDGVVEIENGGVGELRHLTDPRLGDTLRLQRAARFQCGDNGAGDQAEAGERGGSGGYAMAAEKLAGTVECGIRARRDGEAGHMTAQIFAERLDGVVAPLGLLVSRFENDVVQIALRAGGAVWLAPQCWREAPRYRKQRPQLQLQSSLPDGRASHRSRGGKA
jgi:hypothetical protein